MKLNQLILAVVLFASVTATHSAQASFWDYCTSPFKSLASYVWNQCIPLSKSGLEAGIAAKEVEYKEEADRDIKTEHTRKQETDAQIRVNSEKLTALEERAKTLHTTTLSLRERTDLLKASVEQQEQTAHAETKDANAKMKQLGLEVGAIAVARVVLEEQLAQIGKKVASLDEQVGTIARKDAKNEGRLTSVEQEVKKQGIQLSRIRAMLQPSSFEKRTLAQTDYKFGGNLQDKY